MALALRERLFGGASERPREAIAGGLLEARITHVRTTPKRYVLSHRLAYLHLSLADLDRVQRPFLARNGFSLFALNDRDYGDGIRAGEANAMRAWLMRAFESVGAPFPDGDIHLVTLPRVLGFGFNPVSFWLCRDRAGGLRAVLAEVNNTFGERHAYVARKPCGSVIGNEDEITAEKVFHVSPFMPVDGTYRFRFVERDDRLSIRVDLYRDGQRAFSATIGGTLKPLSSGSLLKSFLAHPFPTLQVVMLIHYHAAHLYMRGITFFSKPAPPERLVTASVERTSLSEHS